MSNGAKPPKGPPKAQAKPFLGDDDLNNELDAWDATFDALHAEDAGGAPANQEVMEWPAAAPDATVLTVAAAPAEVDIEDQMTLDRAIDDGGDATLDRSLDLRPSGRVRIAETTADTFDGDEGAETDFSDVGADGPPAALGEILGRHTTAPPIDEPEKTRIQVYPTTPRRAGATQPPPDDDDDEDEVFTSASRPIAPPPRFDEPSFDDDPVAPPPVAPEQRRTPAIIRRTQAGLPTVSAPAEPRKTPAHGVDMSDFSEQTRIQHVGEIEQQRYASRPASKTLPPPIEEDEYEIEIDASASAALPIAVAPETSGEQSMRRTAHVVRRAEGMTRPPPMSFRSSDEVMELDAMTPPPAAGPAPEDDFSDVAAAVGATDDDALGEIAAIRPRRPSTPRASSDLAIEIEEAPLAPGLDDALSALDEPVLQADEDEGAFDSFEDKAPLPTRVEPQGRPPAMADLYPRVKTPTSVPPIGISPSHTLVGVPGAAAARPQRFATSPVEVDVAPEPEPELDLDGSVRAWPEQVAPVASHTLDEGAAQTLLILERELATVDESHASAALRIEAGRLCERLTDLDRARSHYDAALLADPRATAALRGLRRLARASGDLVEAVRHLDAEIAVAGALERRPLGHYRIDLLMASGDQDLARVAVGEVLDSAPSDVRALLAHLELAFLDGRADEFGVALEQIAHAVSDNELRAAVQAVRGTLAAHHNDTAAAASWFVAAAQADPSAIAAQLGAVRHAAAQADGDAASRALLEVARQIEASDPITAAAAAVRAQQWSRAASGVMPKDRAAVAAAAAALATASAPSDPLVARLAAETAAAGGDPTVTGAAFAHWAACARAPAERAYAAARAAELDPAHASELWASVISLDPGDDYAAAQLRTAHVTSEATQAAIDVDLATAEDVERDRARLRAAYGLIAQGQLDAAIDVLTKGRAARPVSVAIGEALGEALAAAGKWTERAQLFAELARQPGEQLDGEVAQLRSAIAWEEAVGAAAALEGSEAPSLDDLQRITAQALEAWERVLELSPGNPTGQAAALVLANRLGDGEVIAEALARAQAAERTPLAAASLAFRRIRLVADDLARSDALLRDIHPLDDPRRTVALVIAAARAGELGEAAAALEERANHLDARTAATEIAALRLRAAQLALDANDAPRAMRLLQQVEAALPNLRVVRDLLAAASRRAGDRPAAAPVRRSEPAIGASSADAFVRAVRDADLSMAHGDAAAALALYQRALEINPGDPLAIVPLVRIATELREPTAITGLALAQLRAAQDAGDHVAKAVAYELLAQIDSDLRNDPGSSQIALESASQADPSRIDLMHRLERGYAADDEIAELLRLRKAELETLPAELSRDRVALQLDIAGLATRDGRTEIELAEMYRGVLKTDPAARLALLHLEAIVRRSGFSDELADVEDKIASYFEGDPKTQAAFWTRAGETLADIGQIDAAVQRFGRAEAAFPGHLPALEGWRQAALKGGLWIDVAEAAARQALNAPDLATQAALHHFAGVALMDKALVGEQAMAAFRRALEANPGHKDAFLRLRILLEEDANHDDLASLLALRLDVETDPAAQVELHRALAELHRNFLSDRETATKHFRAILEAEPNDLRSHAAIADIAWEQGNWQEAADSLMARARLERQPDVLKTLCFRLGLIYADRLVDGPMAIKAFQRALTYQPDDENTLTRLADIAAQIGEWKLALGACERLVKNESDPDRRVAHLHRVARIFKDGFGDRKRSELALNLALDSAPTNDQALQELVQFYKDVSDLTSVRVHLNRVAGAMRARVAQVPLEGVPYRVIARAMAARANTNVAGSLPIARAAAQLADLLGAAGAPEQALINEPAQPDLSQLMRPESDEVLFPRGVQPELRQMFQLLGDRIAKHVGVNIQSYGVSRGDRARGRDNPVAAVAQSVATALGYPEIDVYVTTRQPWVMIAEPTSPVSLILGSSIAAMGGDAIRFAAGGALKLAQASMAIPVRLPVEELGVLVVALLRLFQPEFPILAVDAELVAVQHQKLRRLIPTNLMNELRPFALAVDPARFDHRELSRDLKIAGWRAGLVASGSLLAGLRILAAQAEGELPGFLADPLAQGLVAFALSEDHATVAR